MPSCGYCGHCAKDFSSREPGKPNLATIDVAGGIVSQAVRNTLRRMQEVSEGIISPQEAAAADERLLEWLTQTFSGRNKHFASAEGWNPAGLAQYVREVFAGDLSAAGRHAPRSDAEVIAWLFERFLSGFYDLIHRRSKAQERYLGMENAPDVREFVSFWQGVLVGAPL